MENTNTPRPVNFNKGDRIVGRTPLGREVAGVIKIVDAAGYWLDEDGGDPLAWAPVSRESARPALAGGSNELDVKPAGNISKAAELLVLDSYNELRAGMGHDYGNGQREAELRRRERDLGRHTYIITAGEAVRLEGATIRPGSVELAAAARRLLAPRLRRLEREDYREGTPATRRTRAALEAAVAAFPPPPVAGGSNELDDPGRLDSSKRIDPADLPRSYRVSRCGTCEGGRYAVAWKGGAARPACPKCGAAMATTTRNLKAGFVVLEGEALETAERLEGGLLKYVDHHLERARYQARRVAELEAGVEAGTYAVVEAPRARAWAKVDGVLKLSDEETVRGEAGDVWVRRAGSDYGADNVNTYRREVDAQLAKAAKFRRRLDKLGGPLGAKAVAKAEALAAAEAELRGLATVAGGSNELDATLDNLLGLVNVKRNDELADHARIKAEYERTGSYITGQAAAACYRRAEGLTFVIDYADRLRAAGDVRVAELVLRGTLGDKVAARAAKAYKSDGELEAAEALSAAQDYTDGGGPRNQAGHLFALVVAVLVALVGFAGAPAAQAGAGINLREGDAAHVAQYRALVAESLLPTPARDVDVYEERCGYSPGCSIFASIYVQRQHAEALDELLVSHELGHVADFVLDDAGLRDRFRALVGMAGTPWKEGTYSPSEFFADVWARCSSDGLNPAITGGTFKPGLYAFDIGRAAYRAACRDICKTSARHGFDRAGTPSVSELTRIRRVGNRYRVRSCFGRRI